MTTSPVQFLSEIVNLDRPIPAARLAYFRARFRSRFYQFVLHEFLRLQEERGFTKADLARRLGKKPEQITRWLSAPGHWEFDTASDLLLGCGIEPRMYGQLLSVGGAVQTDDEDWKRARPGVHATQTAKLFDLAVHREKVREKANEEPKSAGSAIEAANPEKRPELFTDYSGQDQQAPTKPRMPWDRERQTGGAAAAGRR